MNAHVDGVPQEWVAALEKPYTMQNIPPDTSAAPSTSTRGRRPGTSRRSSTAAPIPAAAANSTFTYRHHRHDRYSVKIPPSTRPTAPPDPATAPYTANDRRRSSGSVNVVASSDSAVGASSAANAPCTARALISIGKLTAAPPTAEAAANPVMPVRNITLRPTTSASLPPSSSRLPNASAYAVTTHCRSASEKCSARCAEGSAMFMIVASSTIISWAIAITARISHRLGSGWVAARRASRPRRGYLEYLVPT